MKKKEGIKNSEILRSKLSEEPQKRLQQMPGGRLLMCRILKIWNHFLIFGYHYTRIAIYHILYSSLDSNLLHEEFLPHNILIEASLPNLDASEEALNEGSRSDSEIYA